MQTSILTLLIVAAFTFASNAAAEPLRHVRVEDPDAQAVAIQLERSGFDVLEGSVTDSSLELIVSVAELESLRLSGYGPEVIAVGRPFRDIQDERGGGESVPPGYPNLVEIEAEMVSVANNYPAICQMVDITEAYDLEPTYEGHHLYAVKISDNVELEEDEPAFLMVSCHHAREIVTPVLALYAIEQLTTLYGTDPTITNLVDSHEIWIAPLWNPDGYDYVYYWDNMWRKNRRPVAGGIGIDLNRNYPFGWSGPCAGSTNPTSNTYKGPSPASEAETQAMMAWSEDQRFAKVLDYHSSGREVLYGYACWDHPFAYYLRQQAIALSQASSYGGDYRSPSAEGEHFEWQTAMMGGFAFLTETHIQFQPSHASAVDEAERVWPGTVWLLEQSIPLWGHVTNSVTGDPVEATISYDNVTFYHGEINRSEPGHGRYHAFLPPGSYDVVFEANGYETLTVPGVVITAGSSTLLDVALTNPEQSVGSDAGQLALDVQGSNPLTSAAYLRFSIPSAARTSLRIFDVKGGLVRTLTDGYYLPGNYQLIWDGRDGSGREVVSGSYFYRLESGRLRESGRVLLVR
ncbi:MAG: carboxypeptidase regulatory-like domain-containing protein [Candidatus Eisenbacteria sp.]|nr:carboxypeptidase regulatory-like domain-containing protein [Candidatus Eisenbacteria bacterium]